MIENLEAEQAMLGAMLIDETVIEDYFNQYLLEYFYDYKNEKIAETIAEMKIEGIPIDLLTLKLELEKKKLFKKIGGLEYLISLTEIIPSSNNWESYAKILEDYYRRRELLKVANNITRAANNLSEDINPIEEKSIEDILKISQSGKSKATEIEDNITLLEKFINENKSRKLIGYSWGLSWLDELTGGIRKSKTYRIGAPSGVGKTNLIYQVIHSLMGQKAKVLFISLENNIETTYIKYMSSVQGVNSKDLEKGKVELNYKHLRDTSNNFLLTDRLFDWSAIKREIIKSKPDVVILDYIGLVNIKGYDEKSKYDKYADEVKEFMQFHQDIAWIDLSNLNKDDDEEKIRKYMGFNGSAKLRNNPDFALHMFHYKPFYDYKNTILQLGEGEALDKVRGKKVLTFLVSKNRLGPDLEEDEFVIDFNKGTIYEQATLEQKEKWKNNF